MTTTAGEGQRMLAASQCPPTSYVITVEDPESDCRIDERVADGLDELAGEQRAAAELLHGDGDIIEAHNVYEPGRLCIRRVDCRHLTAGWAYPGDHEHGDAVVEICDDCGTQLTVRDRDDLAIRRWLT